MTPIQQRVQGFRQWLQPREFRIDPPEWSSSIRQRLAEAIDTASRAVVEEVRERTSRTAGDAGNVGGGSVGDAEALVAERLAFLAEVGTGLWRMRRSMMPPGCLRLAGAEPREDARRTYRWLETTWEVLQEHGVEILDHTGDPYISGRSLKAHFEAAPHVTRDTVLDTIKPTILLNGRILQMGEVVVGTRDLADGASAVAP